MKVTGIIAEYDPFHNGHAYHLKQAIKITGSDAVIAVISGNFTQRGMPAFFDKRARAHAALLGGADLVLELPYIYSCNAGSEFARGGIEIFERLGIVTDLVFGSECADLDALKKIADLESGGVDLSSASLDADSICKESAHYSLRGGDKAAEATHLELEQENITRKIRKLMGGGMSYPTALCQAVAVFLGTEYGEILKHPNNVLGVEYIRSLKDLKSEISPHCIQRIGTAHTEKRLEENNIRMASGTALRDQIRAKGIEAARFYMPETSFEIFQKEKVFDLQEKMYELLRYKLIAADSDKIRQIYTVTEGIENRLKGAALRAGRFGEFMKEVRTKRYTDARIRRMLIHILTDFTQQDYAYLKGTAYARVLGFSQTGAELLRAIRKKGQAEVISNLSKLPYYNKKTATTLQWEIKARDLISFMTGRSVIASSERQFIPVRV